MTQIVTLLESTFVDTEAVAVAVRELKRILGYNDNGPNYNRLAYERRKERLAAQGQSLWTAAQQKYFQEHKAELNEKRKMYYHQAKQRKAEKIELGEG